MVCSKNGFCIPKKPKFLCKFKDDSGASIKNENGPRIKKKIM